MDEKGTKKVYTSKSYFCENCGSSFIYDADDGVMRCPHCDVSLTAHKDGTLKCHYCGYERKNYTIYNSFWFGGVFVHFPKLF